METKPLSKPFGKPLRKTKCNYSLQHFRNNFEWKLYKKIFQLSLGYPQLTFPMALLTFGLFISIVLASLEKLLHRPKTNFIILLDRFYSFWLSKGLPRQNIPNLLKWKTPRISSLHMIFYWYLTYQYTEIEFQM